MRHTKRIVFTLIAALLASGAQAAEEGQFGIAAVVNEQLISNMDLQDRMSFIMGTTGLTDSAEVRQRLRPQILRTLVDEVLQTQEAGRYNIVVSDEEITQAISSIERQHGKEPGSFEAHLRNKNLPRDTFVNQLRAQISWSKLVLKRFRTRVRINDDEVQRMLAMMASGTTTEWKVATIIMPVDTPKNDASVRKLAEKLVSELRKGADFTAIASQVSSGTQRGGSSAFWVKSEQLDKVVAKKLEPLKPGEISDVIRTIDGYQILKVYDKRNAQLVAPSLAQVGIKQIILKLKNDAKAGEVDLLMDIAKAIQQAPGTCLDKGVAGFKNTDIADISVVFKKAELSKLSPELGKMVASLKVGGISEPFATPSGLQLLQLCERQDIPAEKAQIEKIKDGIFQQKMELEAEKYLRNLRREAFVDIRL